MNTKQEQTTQANSKGSELTDDELEQVTGGVGLLSSPLGAKYQKPATQMWTREVVEDVEAY
jgi:bacteriocin-like protein